MSAVFETVIETGGLLFFLIYIKSSSSLLIVEISAYMLLLIVLGKFYSYPNFHMILSFSFLAGLIPRRQNDYATLSGHK